LRSDIGALRGIHIDADLPGACHIMLQGAIHLPAIGGMRLTMSTAGRLICDWCISRKIFGGIAHSRGGGCADVDTAFSATARTNIGLLQPICLAVRHRNVKPLAKGFATRQRNPLLTVWDAQGIRARPIAWIVPSGSLGIPTALDRTTPALPRHLLNGARLAAGAAACPAAGAAACTAKTAAVSTKTASEKMRGYATDAAATAPASAAKQSAEDSAETAAAAEQPTK